MLSVLQQKSPFVGGLLTCYVRSKKSYYLDSGNGKVT